MQGGFGQSRNNSNKAALTAFVAIAMLESGVERTEQSLVNAFRCIDQQTYDDAYTLSIVAYAYSIFDDSTVGAVNSYRRLMSMAKVDGSLTYWKANENEPAEPIIHWWYYRPRSADTETTAYALLTKLNTRLSVQQKISEGLSIVRWLSTQRNPWGGFGSTQDTVIGLQALSEYASLIYHDGLQASIVVSETATNNQVATFELNDVNSFVEFTEKIPRVTNLTLSSTGKGCFLMQVSLSQ
ncbi:A2ML1 [Bugula neritina]|uniref:A2ML1 n=1 Tax=Bugula neritina TaxID=10212 RepID=A0A7J7JH30_BUGNE|nr:A2ML1 [Bugula neritina]